MNRDYSEQDYSERCTDVELALAATRERIDEWDEVADPHGWWHERPHLIALVNEIERLRALADDLAEGLRHYQLHFGDSCSCDGDCPLPALLQVAWDREEMK